MIEKKLRELNKTADRLAETHIKLMVEDITQHHRELNDVVSVMINTAIKIMVDLTNISVNLAKEKGGDLCGSHLLDVMMLGARSFIKPCEKHRIGKH